MDLHNLPAEKQKKYELILQDLTETAEQLAIIRKYAGDAGINENISLTQLQKDKASKGSKFLMKDSGFIVDLIVENWRRFSNRMYWNGRIRQVSGSISILQFLCNSSPY